MADDQITAAARDALTKVPQFLLRGVDPSKLKVVVTPNSKQGYHSDAIASVDVGDPNTIQVHDAKAFLQPGAAVQTMAHELTHVQQNRVHPSIPFQPINAADPYGYDANNIKADSTKYSPEQLGAMVQQYTRIQNAPNLNPQQKAQLSAPYAPVLNHFASLPQTTITPTDPSDTGINTTPLAPSAPEGLGNLPLDAAAVQPAAVNPSAPNDSDWEDVPSQGSGVQSSESDWEDVPPQQTPAQQNKQSLQQGLIGAGKGLAQDVIMGTPAAGLMMSGELGHGLDASNPDQVAGKVANTGVQLALGGGADAVDSLVSLAKSGIGKVTGQGAIDALHSSLGSTLQKAAADAGVEVKPTDNIRKVVGNLADAIRAKAQTKADELDDAFQGLKFMARGEGGKFTSGNAVDLGLPQKFSGFDEQLSKLNDKLQSLSGSQNIEKRAEIQMQIKELTQSKLQASNALDRQGLGSARDEADRLFQQADELDNLKKAHNRATQGMPGKTNPVKFAQEIEPLHSSGQLETALGPEHSENLMDATSRASRIYGRTQTAQKIAKGIGSTAVRAAGYGAGMDLFK